MEILQIVGIGLVATVLSLTIKKQVPEISLMVGIVASIVIYLLVLPQLASVFQVVNILASSSNIGTMYIDIILKIIGIAYIAEFGSQICIDAGENSIASKIEISGKILIMVVSMPIMMALIELILNIFPT